MAPFSIEGASSNPGAVQFAEKLRVQLGSALVGVAGTEAQRAAFESARREQDEYDRTYAVVLERYKEEGLEPPPNCSTHNAALVTPVKPLSSIPGVLAIWKQACDAGKEFAVASFLAPNATSPSAPQLWVQTKKLAEMERAASIKAAKHFGDRQEYRAARAEYDRLADLDDSPDKKESPASVPASTAAASAPDAAASAPASKVGDALARLQKVVAKLAEADDKLSLELISQERIAAANELLGALQNPKAAGAEGETRKDQAGRALKRLEAAYDKWKDAQTQASDTLKRPALMLEQIEQANATLIRRSIASDRAELAIQRQRVEVLERQAKVLNTALQEAKGVEGQTLESIIADQTAKAE